jgi:hypothetical protein
MNRIRKVGEGMNVQPLFEALQAHPELWDQTPDRTAPAHSPHHDLHDIYIRYGENPLDAQPHESLWYPAASILPVKDLIFDLMYAMRGERLGGVLITRIPPGKMCKPHRDGGWHAGYYEKFGIQIQSAPGQAFCFEGESLETKPGDVFWFDNAYTHWVTNDTPHDRITLIVTLKRGA